MKRPALSTLKLCIKLLVFLVEHRFGGTLDELAEELDITRRQVYRYKKALEGAGIQLTEHRTSVTQKKTWRLKDRPRFARLVGRGL